MRRFILFFVLLITSLSSAPTILAQADGDVPYFVIIDSDLYAIHPDGTQQRLTARPNSRITAWQIGDRDVYPSPDGRYVVYRDVADYAAEAWNANETGNVGELPSDLYLIDLQTEGEIALATHPDEARWAGSAHLYRAGGDMAAWSPDSHMFAYVEMSTAPSGPTLSRLIAVDIPSGESTIWREWATSTGGASRLQWTVDGLQQGTFRYDGGGNIVAQVYLYDDVSATYPVRVAGRDYVAIEMISSPEPEGLVYLLDLETGDLFETPGYVSVVSRAAPETSLVLLDYTNDTRPSGGVITQEGRFLLGATPNPPYPVSFTLAPDGTRFAYTEVGQNARGSLIGDATGKARIVDGRIVAWGADFYTVIVPGGAPDLQPTTRFESSEVCGRLPAVGLVRGGSGIVLGETPNRLRSAPHTDAEILGMIPVGATFAVVDGQQDVCSAGIRWAQVSYDGMTGWTAERAGGDPFVAPQ